MNFLRDNIIYHEGAKHQVDRVLLSSQNPEERFLRAKLCLCCGYVHEGDAANSDLCQHCGIVLAGDNSLYLASLLEMPAVATRRVERITCDEEERRREGYEITTHYRFAPTHGERLERHRAQALADGTTGLLDLTYAPQASIWRGTR